MKKIFLLLSCAVILSGCTKSNIVTPQEIQKPDLAIKEGIQIDWNQVQDELNKEYVKSSEYPFGQEIEFYSDDNDMSVYIMATVEDGTPKDEAAAYATSMIKNFNDSISDQDFSVERSSETSYGGYFQNYTVWIQVMPASTKDDESTWLVDDAVVAAAYADIVPNDPANPNWPSALMPSNEAEGEAGTAAPETTAAGETAAE